jgi:hypothetical protein
LGWLNIKTSRHHLGATFTPFSEKRTARSLKIFEFLQSAEKRLGITVLLKLAHYLANTTAKASLGEPPLNRSCSKGLPALQ